jgi:hypothetical protein
MDNEDDRHPPILTGKAYGEASAFTPENLLREARRQKSLSVAPVPATCFLDPDGDIVRYLIAEGRGRKHPEWACYHTDLHVFDDGKDHYGILGGAIGAGQILPLRDPPYFIAIDRALRDEGTSYHYCPPAVFSHADPALLQHATAALAAIDQAVAVGATWTTDAPFRETEAAINAAKEAGCLAVEMEASALYAFASARHRRVLCFAHVTNQMALIEGDFEKGAANGAETSLRVLTSAARALNEDE